MDKDTLFYKKRTIRCNTQIVDLNQPLIMGILNITPDSFFDGGKYNSLPEAEEKVRDLLQQGADIIDIGAYSSRPGAENISTEKELNRISPVLDMIRTKFPGTIISVDTFRSKIARETIEKYKVDIINDISAGNIDEEILDVVAETKTAYIAMHMLNTPDNMQNNPSYKHAVKDIIDYFARKLHLLQDKKIHDIIIDPGFGFGKTIEHNYQLLAHLDEFRFFEYPVLVGLSRKSMIYKFLNTTPDKALTGTIALNLIALQKGAAILRVHDVLEAKQTVELYNKIQSEAEKSFNLLINKN